MTTTTKLPSDSDEQYRIYWERLKEAAQYHPANRYRYALIFSTLRKHLKPDTTVLDMGCGDARLLQHLRNISPKSRFFGSDISYIIVTHDKERIPLITFFQGDVSADTFIAAANDAGVQYADIIIASEVIEHVHNDITLLTNAATLLSPGGILVLTTQAGRRYRVDLELLHHLRHYDRKLLEQMIRQAGLEIEVSFNCGFPILNIQKFLVNAMFTTVIRAAASSGRPPFIARAAMSIMYTLLRFSPPGLGPQLFIVARKPS